MYNPLLGHNVRIASWYDIAEALQVKIAYTCLRGKPESATYHLNVLDLIDNEASAYWREWGLDLYSGKEPVPQARKLASVREAYEDDVVRAEGVDPNLLLD